MRDAFKRTVFAAFGLAAAATFAFSGQAFSQEEEDPKSCGELAGGVAICEPWLYDQCQHHSQCVVEQT